MNKNLALFLSAVLILGAVSTVSAADNGSEPYAVINESTIPKNEVVEPPISITAFEYDPQLYPKPDLKHAIASYKGANYTGAAQELLSYLAKNSVTQKPIIISLLHLQTSAILMPQFRLMKKL